MTLCNDCLRQGQRQNKNRDTCDRCQKELQRFQSEPAWKGSATDQRETITFQHDAHTVIDTEDIVTILLIAGILTVIILLAPPLVF